MFKDGKRIAMFPKNISESQLSVYKNCPTQWFFQNAMCMTTSKSIHLSIGSIISEAMEEARRTYFIEGKDKDLAVEDASYNAADKALRLSAEDYLTNKNPAKVKQVLQRYFQVFPLDLEDDPYLCSESGQTGIEHTLLHPLPINHPETGKPLMFKGKLDFLTKSSSNKLKLIDEKSTSRIKSDIPKEIDQLRSAGQFLGYAWLGKQNNLVINSCEIRKLILTNSSVDAVSLPYAITPYAVNNWYLSTLQVVQAMVNSYKDMSEELENTKAEASTDYVEFKHFPQNFSTGCTAYNSTCAFLNSCLSGAGYISNKATFPQIVYNSVEKTEVPMEEFEYESR